VQTTGEIIRLVLNIYIGLLLVRLVVDWIQYFARSWTPSGPALVLLEAVYSATDPPINAFRKIFKPVRIGSVSLDLSFLAVLLVCYLLRSLTYYIF
jgi:YggT family protein